MDFRAIMQLEAGESDKILGKRREEISSIIFHILSEVQGLPCHIFSFNTGGYKIIIYNRKTPGQLQLQNDIICYYYDKHEKVLWIINFRYKIFVILFTHFTWKMSRGKVLWQQIYQNRFEGFPLHWTHLHDRLFDDDIQYEELVLGVKLTVLIHNHTDVFCFVFLNFEVNCSFTLSNVQCWKHPS